MLLPHPGHFYAEIPSNSIVLLVVAMCSSVRIHLPKNSMLNSTIQTYIDSIKPSFLCFSMHTGWHYNARDKQRALDENFRVALIRRPFKCLEKPASIQPTYKPVYRAGICSKINGGQLAAERTIYGNQICHRWSDQTSCGKGLLAA